jgi:hypothetical protein
VAGRHGVPLDQASRSGHLSADGEEKRAEKRRRETSRSALADDVPRGTTDEASPLRVLAPIAARRDQAASQIVPPRSPDPMLGEPPRSSRREARTRERVVDRKEGKPGALTEASRLEKTLSQVRTRKDRTGSGPVGSIISLQS